MDEPSRSSRATRALRDGGLMHPESCPIVLKALEGVQSEDSQKRIIGISRVNACLEHLWDVKQNQVLLNLVVFVLERGVARGIAAAMRAIARGDWIHILPEKDISVSSKSRTNVVVNIAFDCGRCLHFLAADRRCISTILKDFPDLATISKAIFVAKPSDRRFPTGCLAEFEKRAKVAMMGVLLPVVGTSQRFRKQLAEDTSFVREVLKHAESIKDDCAQEDLYAGSASLLYNILLEKTANILATLREDLVRFTSRVLGTSSSREDIDLATRMLVLLLPLDDQQAGTKLRDLEVKHPLGSSLLALLGIGGSLDLSLKCFAGTAFEWWYIDDLAGLDEAKRTAFLEAFVKSNPTVVTRAAELSRIFSAPLEEPSVYHVRLPNAGQGSGKPQLDSFPIKERLECRKCSRASCENLEAEAGTFKVCSRCKMAVYCSRVCQKQAWKEGHNDLCR